MQIDGLPQTSVRNIWQKTAGVGGRRPWKRSYKRQAVQMKVYINSYDVKLVDWWFVL